MYMIFATEHDKGNFSADANLHTIKKPKLQPTKNALGSVNLSSGLESIGADLPIFFLMNDKGKPFYSKGRT
jgi:hypothetical protein